MFALLMAASVLSSPALAPRPQAPHVLHCRIEIPAGGQGDCRVSVPAGRRVRACTEADRQAGHCDSSVDGGSHVAWVVGTGPGRCRITKKKTRWDSRVAAKLSKSEGAASTCDLYVEVR